MLLMVKTIIPGAKKLILIKNTYSFNMIYQKIPEDFKPKFEVAGCFIQYKNEFILLHRQSHKPQGNTWGIPSGKIDKGENLLEAVCREIFEETGLNIPQNKIKFFTTLYVKHYEYDLVYHMFYSKLNNRPDIKISEQEHKGAVWVSPKDSLTLPLIHDLESCIKLFFNQ